MQPKGAIGVDILADGTLKTETGDMGGPMHGAADGFMKLVAQLMGGTVTDKQLKAHTHADGFSHSHAHGSGEHHHQ
jgi:hypothetical protein